MYYVIKKYWLWFDVGIKRYTTNETIQGEVDSCGLMQESKDIQQPPCPILQPTRCGLMQESKDIQHAKDVRACSVGCGLMQESKDIQLSDQC